MILVMITHEEQIGRYSKNMLFWIKHKPNIGSNTLWRMDSDVQAKLIYVTSHMSQLQRKILELTPALQKNKYTEGLQNCFIINDQL